MIINMAIKQTYTEIKALARVGEVTKKQLFAIHSMIIADAEKYPSTICHYKCNTEQIAIHVHTSQVGKYLAMLKLNTQEDY